jgi:arginyl-tRNA synthetase
VKEILEDLLISVLKRLRENDVLRVPEIPPIIIERPKDDKHGDLATNLPLILAAREKTPPLEIAQSLYHELENEKSVFSKIEIAKPGFINFFLDNSFLYKRLEEVEKKGSSFGSSDTGRSEKVLVEFVSANPTGPLHVGHGRGAVTGDVVANLLKRVGYDVEKEYYINNVGVQMELLGKSVYIRYQQLLGRDIPFIENGYKGDYIFSIAKEVILKKGDHFLDKEEEALSFFVEFSSSVILKGIEDDLKDFGVTFDSWFSEKSLFDRDEVNKAIEWLKDTGLAYEKDGALWLRSSDFEDEKDRVIIKANGSYTYFASDIAYHRDKIKRGFKKIIDIWGADHHGYIPRMRAVIKALGYDIGSFRVILVQLVNLLRDGTLVSMSTRSGEFVTLAEIVQEVGKDAARFFFLMRHSDSHLDFDLELAKKQSNENPVYYVQYAHARICSVFRTAEEKGLSLPSFDDADLSLLELPEEISLIKQIAWFPDVVKQSALHLEPHRLVFYLQELAGSFHSYYYKNRIVTDDAPLTVSRLVLIRAIQTVLKNSFSILGINAPEKM